jgi:hypothetical protein
MIMGFNLSCSMKSKCWLLQVGKKGENTNTWKLQNFKKKLFGNCFPTIYENGRVIIFSELLNKCMDKPYLAYLLSSEYNHHVYANAPTLGYSFDKLGDEASLVGMSAIPP